MNNKFETDILLITIPLIWFYLFELCQGIGYKNVYFRYISTRLVKRKCYFLIFGKNLEVDFCCITLEILSLIRNQDEKRMNNKKINMSDNTVNR